jgi:hypothetical protein
MQNNLNSNSNNNKAGSSTLEFIFCAPLLVILMFIAMELNERIEQRVNATIAAGNSAWIALPQPGPGQRPSELEALAKADILGVRHSSSPEILKLNNGDVLPDSNVVLSYTDSKRRADSYASVIERQQNPRSTKIANDRAKIAVGSSSKDQIMAQMHGAARLASNLSRSISEIDIPLVGRIVLFPTSDIEQHRLTWSLTQAGSTNLAIAAIEGLSKSIDQDMASHVIDPTTKNHKLLAHKSVYLRRDPAYHPNRYENQSLMGLAAGSGEYDAWVEDCFMKFESGVCGESNGFYGYVERIYYLMVTAKTIIDIATSSCIAASMGFGAAACIVPKVGVDKAVDLVQSHVEKKITNKINSVISNIVEEITKAVPPLNLKDLTNLDKFTRDFETQLETIVQEAFPP